MESKGTVLGNLLAESEKIHLQMRELFIKNNIDILDLGRLPDNDRAEWYRLKSITDDLSDQMCNLILK